MKHTTAQWSISLDCECPHCLEDVDLVSLDGFWEEGIAPLEHMTAQTRKAEFTCPHCQEPFTVELEY